MACCMRMRASRTSVERHVDQGHIWQVVEHVGQLPDQPDSRDMQRADRVGAVLAQLERRRERRAAAVDAPPGAVGGVGAPRRDAGVADHRGGVFGDELGVGADGAEQLEQRGALRGHVTRRQEPPERRLPFLGAGGARSISSSHEQRQQQCRGARGTAASARSPPGCVPRSFEHMWHGDSFSELAGQPAPEPRFTGSFFWERRSHAGERLRLGYL
jgi:hypothetical protein